MRTIFQPASLSSAACVLFLRTLVTTTLLSRFFFFIFPAYVSPAFLSRLTSYGMGRDGTTGPTSDCIETSPTVTRVFDGNQTCLRLARILVFFTLDSFVSILSISSVFVPPVVFSALFILIDVPPIRFCVASHLNNLFHGIYQVH